jgi:hypothetical protein
MGIHRSKLNLDSGLFRVVQCRSSMWAKGREKTGMTVLGLFVFQSDTDKIMQLNRK